MVKSKKIVCVLTGKTNLYSGEYLQKKIQEYGSEVNLNKFYICKEAKSLLKKGYKVNDVRKILDVPLDAEPLSKDILEYVEKEFQKTAIKINDTTYDSLSTVSDLTFNKSDPDVEQFINNIILKKL
jgi:ABC-type transport system substrate-binding protein